MLPQRPRHSYKIGGSTYDSTIVNLLLGHGRNIWDGSESHPYLVGRYRYAA